jgi:hypothetical protein
MAKGTQIKAGGKTYGIVEVRPYFLYDTVEIPTTGVTEAYTFLTPEGKTLSDTNLKQFSQIPVGWVFEIHSIRLIPRAKVSINDLETVLEGWIVSYIKEGDTSIFDCPAIVFNAGCGLHGAVATTATATTIDTVSLGLPSSGAVWKPKFPLYIRGGETFNFRHRWSVAPTPSTAVKIYHLLDGVLKRPVRGA